MLKTGSLAATDGIKDACYQFIESVLTNMTLKGTPYDLFIRNFERWSQNPGVHDRLYAKDL